VADLYKADLTIPLSFKTVAAGSESLERRVRQACRDAFREERLLQRIVPDIHWLMTLDDAARSAPDADGDFDSDDAVPGGLWDGEGATVAGGVNHADEPEDDTRGLPDEEVPF